MIVRVGETGRPAFQLRPGEAGISVFDTTAVEPELERHEILEAFRPESHIITVERIHLGTLKLQIVPVAGDDRLPDRLRLAHAEIRSDESMSRGEFKRQLKELERHVR